MVPERENKMNDKFKTIMDGVVYGRKINGELADTDRRECAIIKQYCMRKLAEIRKDLSSAYELMLECTELWGPTDARRGDGLTRCPIGGQSVEFLFKAGANPEPWQFVIYHTSKPADVIDFAAVDKFIEIAEADAGYYSFRGWVDIKQTVDALGRRMDYVTDIIREAKQRFVIDVEDALKNCMREAELAENANRPYANCPHGWEDADWTEEKAAELDAALAAQN